MPLEITFLGRSIRNLSCIYEREVLACALSSYAGGKAIENFKPTEDAIDKGDFAHHAVVGKADYIAQEAALKKLNEYDPDADFITEEHVQDESFRRRVIGNSDIERMRTGRVYIIDELDGSSAFDKGHYDWSVSVGHLRNMEHIAGAVCAPQIYNGRIFLAGKGNGTHVWNGSQLKQTKVSDVRDLKKAYVIAGLDCGWPSYPPYNKLWIKLGDKARTVGTNTCAIGLGLVAAGNADAIVQPLQSPWDWAAGKLLVEEAGGKVIFYEMEQTDQQGDVNIYDRIQPIERLEPKHYDPSKRAVGFVAGNEKLADEIMEMLLTLSM